MYGLDYSSSSPDRWLPSLNLHTFPGQDTENSFIGQNGVQGEPATVVTAIPPMKHCPANFLQIVGRIIKMSTRKRAHGLCLEDAFLAVHVRDESIAAVDHQRRRGEAQASTTRTSEAQAMDNRPATTGTDRTPAAASN